MRTIRVLCPRCMVAMMLDDKDKNGNIVDLWYTCNKCHYGAVQTRVKSVVTKTIFYNSDGDEIKRVGGIDNEVVLQFN